MQFLSLVSVCVRKLCVTESWAWQIDKPHRLFTAFLSLAAAAAAAATAAAAAAAAAAEKTAAAAATAVVYVYAVFIHRKMI